MTQRKGIILSGGNGRRMFPASLATNKQLFPVYDKPLIYYSLSTLMLSGIREILIVVSPHERERFQRLLGDGSQWGLEISFVVQVEPKGVAHAFLIAEDFIGNNTVCLILGDNIIFGNGLSALLTETSSQTSGATIFSYAVKNPGQYGIVDFDEDFNVLDIKEKPENSKSNYAVIGIYYYDNSVVDFAKSIVPSLRGELEITDINLKYLAENKLSTRILGRGMAWLDAGTPKSMLDAANFIYTLEERQGLKVCCPEEIAWRLNYITDEQLCKIINNMQECEYEKYLRSLLLNKRLEFSAYYEAEL